LKVLNIFGSPRKNGTSSRIAHAFTETAAAYGATVIDYPLNQMQYRGCQGCEGCHTRSNRCVLLDDVTPLLEDMYSADIVVFSSPIYFGDTCGQFKLFYDRMWSLISTDAANDAENSSRLPPGKVAVLILTHVERPGVYNDVVERYTDYLELYGFEVHSITAGGLPLQSNSDIDEHLAVANRLARELAVANRLARELIHGE